MIYANFYFRNLGIINIKPDDGVQNWLIGTPIPQDVTATFNNGTLTISGTGAMMDFLLWDTPWYDLSDNIKNVVFSSGITKIGNSAFFPCSNLTSIHIPESVTSIGNDAFSNSGLTSIIIPKSVTSIGTSAFYRCSALTDVMVKWATPLSINSNVFQEVTVSKVRLYIPRGATALYQAAPVWKDFIIIGDVEATEEIQATEVKISWYEVPAATSYNLTVYKDEAHTQVFGSYSIAASGQAQNPAIRSALRASDSRLSYTINGLSPETSYWYTITAFENTNIIAIFTEDFVTQIGNVSDNDFVVINDVRWATRNVAAPGTFAAKPEDTGMLYQWNRNVGWSVTDPLINSNGGTTWDSSIPAGTTWEKANDPSPSGWRIPTLVEIQKLLDTNKVSIEWITENGVRGRKFTDKATGNSIFLPATGDRNPNNGTRQYVGTIGDFWSNTQYSSSYAYNLYFDSGNNSGSIVGGYSDRRFGFSVRSVKESSTGIDNILANQLQIFPNPTKDEIFIKSDLPIEKVEIYSLTGIPLLSENNFTEKISVFTLPRGVYVLKVHTDKGLIISKLLKE